MGYLIPVLGTWPTFSATAPLARTEKRGARRGGAEEKIRAWWQWHENNSANSRHFRAIFEPNFAYKY